MTPEIVIDLFREALLLAIHILIVIIMPSLVVGLIVSLFQAATQINEQTLSFLPRLIATLLVLSIAAPWLGEEIGSFTHALVTAIPGLIG